MGFPHFSTRTGACLCLRPCCWGPSGCKCKTGCSGVGHSSCPAALAAAETVNRPDTLEAERVTG
jgi:hypothetical protein